MKYGRNEPCPCGSGKKIKKCHSELAGLTREFVIARGRATQWAQRILDDLRRTPGYVPPPAADTGWSVQNFRDTGCPYGVCQYQTGTGPCQSPMCGVDGTESSLVLPRLNLVDPSVPISRPV